MVIMLLEDTGEDDDSGEGDDEDGEGFVSANAIHRWELPWTQRNENPPGELHERNYINTETYL